MITCFIRYKINRQKIAEFEQYARRWISLVNKFGGQHHGYYLPSEGKSDEAFCLFSFSSLAEYERYRKTAASDEDALNLIKYADDDGFLVDWERSFYRPVLEGN